MKLSATKFRLISLGLAILLATPLSPGPLTGLYLWTSPFIMLNTALARHTLGVLHLVAVLVLIVSLIRHRWYCKWICPAGVLCDAASKTRNSAIRTNRIPGLNKIVVITGLVIAIFGLPLLSLLDPINIFYAFFNAFYEQPAGIILLRLSGLILVVAVNFAVPHVWCRKLCPLGGLQDMLTSLRHLFTKKEKIALHSPEGRRLALGTLLGFGFGLTFRKAVAFTSKTQIRPPGAMPEVQFKTVCIRCGNCIKACPTAIIRPCFDPSDIMGLLTPHIAFDTSYCLRDCTLCGDVCPSTAIKRFTQTDKQKLFMGVARIQRDGCLLTEHKECDLCRRYCEYDAVKIESSNGDLNVLPEILTDRCVGCGACKVVCPVSVIDILPV